jgi:hypothetical protein
LLGQLFWAQMGQFFRAPTIAGENRWELVTIPPNNVAYLKRPREDYGPDGDDVE